jgi:hypothetical protein
MDSTGTELKSIFLPDLHFGNPRIDPRLAYENVHTFVFPKIPEVDLLLIGGDFFDAQISFDNASGIYAMRLITELLETCFEHNVIIRIVDGTFAHDRRQWEMFAVGAHVYDTKLKNGLALVKTFDNVDVEKLPNGFVLVYIPDELPYDVIDRAKGKLKQIGETKADIVAQHGFLQHLVPEGMEIRNRSVRAVEEYDSVCRGIILNGHVHHAVSYKNSLSGGSFERLTHGEEESKGFHLVTLKRVESSITTKITFIENTGASPFVTMDLLDFGDSFIKAEKYITQQLKLHPQLTNPSKHQTARVRLKTNCQTLVQQCLIWFKQKHPRILVTTLQSRHQLEQYDHEVSFDVPIITPDNLVETIHVAINRSLTHDTIRRYLIPTT